MSAALVASHPTGGVVDACATLDRVARTCACDCGPAGKGAGAAR
jgi:hypothetical protein